MYYWHVKLLRDRGVKKYLFLTLLIMALGSALAGYTATNYYDDNDTQQYKGAELLRNHQYSGVLRHFDQLLQTLYLNQLFFLFSYDRAALLN